MKQKFITLLAFFAITALGVNAQVANLTPEQLEAEKTAKTDQITALQGDIDKINTALATMDQTGWRFGGNGGITFSGAGANNWWAAGDTVQNGLNTNITANVFGNLSEDKFYWFNGLNVQLGFLTNWFNLGDNGLDWSNTLDKIYFSSLPGYRINSELAATGLLDVQSSIRNFANPAAISGGIGVTWTPVQTMDGKLIPLRVVFHPLTWKGNFVKKDGNEALRREFGLTGDKTVASEFGLKFVADYGRTLKILGNNIGWTTQLRGFAPYTKFTPLKVNPDDPTGDLIEGPATGPMELNWDNAFSILLFKNLAVSANWNLRNYKPETAFLFDKTREGYDPDQEKNWQHLWNFGFGLNMTF